MIGERASLIGEALSYPAPDRPSAAAAYSAMGDYQAAFAAASLSDGSGSREEAYLAIATTAASNGAIDVARRALEPIDYQRNVARANLAVAVALGKAGRHDEAAEYEQAARDANSNMIRRYAYHALLASELIRAGDLAGATQQADEISGEYWTYGANALLTIAWAQHENGEVEAARRTLRRVQGLVVRSGSAGSRLGIVPDFELIMAEMFVSFGDHAAALDLIRDATDIGRYKYYGQGDFDRVTAVLLLNTIEAETGYAYARTLADEIKQVAIDNLIVENRRIGFPTGFHYFSKVELVRLLIEEGRSEWLDATLGMLGRDARTSLITAIAQAEASLGNLDRAEIAAMSLERWRDRCTAFVMVFTELAMQERSEYALRIANAMEREGCSRLSVTLPHALFANLSVEAALLGDSEFTCEALRSVERNNIWISSIGGIAEARVRRRDYGAARDVVRWAYSTGNISGAEASQTLALIAFWDPEYRDEPEVFPPVLGTTSTFAALQRSIRRYPIWFEDGIWDQ